VNNLLEQSFITELSDHEQKDDPPADVTSISEARLLANRENAKLSTGPKSEAGRETVSANSITHGLSGKKFRVLASESQCDYEELFQNLLATYAPADPGESELVTSMAQALWMTRRAAARQDRCLEALESGDADAVKAARLELPLYLRYQTTQERAYARHSAELRKLQSDRRKAELGFASQKAKQEMHQARVAAVKARTDYQLMKNRSLQYDIANRDRHELECQRDREKRERWAEQDRQREAELQAAKKRQHTEPRA
jgi:hypothetical protein